MQPTVFAVYHALILSPTVWATNLVSSVGYAGIATALFVDSAGVPIPSEVVLPLAGALAHQGRFSLAGVLIVGIAAQTAGAWVSYELGRKWGTPLVARYGRYVLLKQHDLDRATTWFNRFGGWASLLGRVVPVVRSYIGYPAGVAQFSRTRFLTASVVGSTVWAALLVALGYSLSSHLDTIDHLFQRFNLVIGGLLVVGVIWYVWRRYRRP